MFVNHGQQVTEVVGVLETIHAEPQTWAKIAEVLIDYLRWFRRQADWDDPSPFNYDAVERTIQRDTLRSRKKAGRRRGNR